MNILYKYCDQLGIIKILGMLQLKLPRISEVNDCYECDPAFICNSDLLAFEKACLLAFKRRNTPVPNDFKELLPAKFRSDEYKARLIEGMRQAYDEWQQKGCLLSVSGTSKNPAMWAHYADRHKGAVIGIDFDSIYSDPEKASCLKMRSVTYSDTRLEVDVLQDPLSEEGNKRLIEILMTKSNDWRYEKEFRNVFYDLMLEDLQKQGLATCREIDKNKTWFLKLNPASVKEIVFGLDTDESLKSAIKKLLVQPGLEDVRLYQAVESKESYNFDLIEQYSLGPGTNNPLRSNEF